MIPTARMPLRFQLARVARMPVTFKGASRSPGQSPERHGTLGGTSPPLIPPRTMSLSAPRRFTMPTAAQHLQKAHGPGPSAAGDHSTPTSPVPPRGAASTFSARPQSRRSAPGNGASVNWSVLIPRNTLQRAKLRDDCQDGEGLASASLRSRHLDLAANRQPKESHP